MPGRQARLARADAEAQGWLLDGYPRSAEQAEAIEEVGIRPDIFILIEARAGPPVFVRRRDVSPWQDTCGTAERSLLAAERGMACTCAPLSRCSVVSAWRGSCRPMRLAGSQRVLLAYAMADLCTKTFRSLRNCILRQ